MPEWDKVLLGDIADEITVGHVGSMTNEYIDQGVPFLRSQNVQPFRIDWSDTKYISTDFHARLRKSALTPGDVVIVRTGKPGTCAVIPEDLPSSNCADLVIIRPGGDLDSRFLMYYVNTVAAAHVDAHLVGAVQQHFNVGSARQMRLHLPDIYEQRAIASVLGSLDDKIELNRRMNRTLEQMAAAIFKAWFVDFEPVRAKASGAASFPGMPQPVFDALPATFADSELGPIPEGWEVKSLDEIADYLNGLALQKYPPDDGPSLPRLKIAELRKGSTEGAELSSARVPAKYIIHDGDVIFSWSGSLLVKIWTGGDAALNQHLFKVTSERYPKWFYYLWTAHHLEDFQRTASSKATTMGHIKRHHLSDAKVVVPPADSSELMGMMTRTIQPLLELIIANDTESRCLATARDALLPKLLSGEVRVAEQLSEEVLV